MFKRLVRTLVLLGVAALFSGCDSLAAAWVMGHGPSGYRQPEPVHFPLPNDAGLRPKGNPEAIDFAIEITAPAGEVIAGKYVSVNVAPVSLYCDDFWYSWRFSWLALKGGVTSDGVFTQGEPNSRLDPSLAQLKRVLEISCPKR